MGHFLDNAAPAPNRTWRDLRPDRGRRPESERPVSAPTIGAGRRLRLAAQAGLLLACISCAPPSRLDATATRAGDGVAAPREAMRTAQATPETISDVPAAESPEQTAPIAPAGGFMTNDAAGRATAYWAATGRGAGAPSWKTVAGDGFHDPDSDAIATLQNPRAALSQLPRGDVGNYVDWVQALRSGAIRPRAEVRSAGAMRVLDLDVLMAETKSMPTVTFPHAIHTEWLSCASCHDRLFPKSRRPLRMVDIFRGQACGACHGKVAFPPLQCFTCHNGPRKQAEAE